MARTQNTRKTAQPTPAKETAPKAAPAKVADKPAPANCRCGCGQPTVTTKATFVSGHDARLAGVLGRKVAEGTLTEQEQTLLNSLSDKLQAKVAKVADTARGREAKKAAAKAAKAVAKAAYEQALADALAKA